MAHRHPSLDQPAWLRAQPRTRVAIFDLDRTVIPGSSLNDLVAALLAEGLISRSVVVRHVLTKALFAKRGVGTRRVDQIRDAALSVIADLDYAVMLDVARASGRVVASRAYPAARRVIDRHLRAGDFCVILSAAPQELVEAVASAIGIQRAVGTRAAVNEGRLTGELDGPFCYGPGKLARLATEVGPVDFALASGYSDSISDLPLLTACRYSTAVNPDRKLRAVARRNGWPVLHLG